MSSVCVDDVGCVVSPCSVVAAACAASVVESSSGFPIHVRDEEGPSAVRERSAFASDYNNRTS